MNLEEAILQTLAATESIPASRLLQFAMIQDSDLWISWDAFIDAVALLVERGIVCVSDEGLYRLRSEAERSLTEMGIF